MMGVNLALKTEFRQGADALQARLELWDAARDRVIASRTVETSIAQPFQFLDRTYREAARMLKLRPRGPDAAAETGVRGAGTLRYLLQGMGRTRSATSADQLHRRPTTSSSRAGPSPRPPCPWRGSPTST
jgi:hypothetical protein